MNNKNLWLIGLGVLAWLAFVRRCPACSVSMDGVSVVRPGAEVVPGVTENNMLGPFSGYVDP